MINTNHKRSFTLVELLIVIVIIAALSSFALPQYRKAVERARQTEGIGILRVLRDAQLRYYFQYGVYFVSEDRNELNKAFDVEIPVPKYFNGMGTYDEGKPIIAYVRRGKNQDVGYGEYYVNIFLNGSFESKDGPGGLP